MSYQNNIQREGIDSRILCVLKPRRRVVCDTLFSGSVYYGQLDFNGKITSVTVDGVALTEGTSTSLSAGQYYAASELYIRKSDSSDPTSNFVVVTYEIYVATAPINWHRVPTDTSTDQVHFEGVITQAPVIRAALEDLTFGFLPIQSSQLQISNVDGFMYQHVYSSSFNLAPIDVYHLSGPLKSDNIRKVYSGLMGNITAEDAQVTITIQDRFAVFNQNFAGEYWPASFDVGPVHPEWIGRPIYQVYGKVDGVRATNCNYNESTAIGLNNTWLIGPDTYARTVPGLSTFALNTSTTTRTYVNSLDGISVGDYVTIFVTPTSNVVKVTNINYGSSYFEHAAIPVAASSTSSISLFRIPKVCVFMDGRQYELTKPGIDYTFRSTNGFMGITISGSIVADYSLSRFVGPNDTVYLRTYGKATLPTISSVEFGSLDPKTLTITNPVVILYDLMTTYMGISESDIDTASFVAMEAAIAERIGFCSPAKANEDFPTYKDLIVRILQTCLLRMSLDSNIKWTLTQVGPAGSSDRTIEDQDLFGESIAFDFNYQDLVSDVIVEYAQREISDDIRAVDGSFQRVTATSNVAKHVHSISRQRTFTSLHFDQADAQTLANRLALIYGERQGRIHVLCGIAQLDSYLGDVVTVSRERLPGFDYDSSTTRTRLASVISTEKSHRQVALTLDDQKGIEDADSW